jgi:hypothetical protein
MSIESQGKRGSEKISRRDALKMMGSLAAGAAAMASEIPEANAEGMQNQHDLDTFAVVLAKLNLDEPIASLFRSLSPNQRGPLYEGLVAAMQRRGVDNERDASKAMKNVEIAKEAIRYALEVGTIDFDLAAEIYEAYRETYLVRP